MKKKKPYFHELSQKEIDKLIKKKSKRSIYFRQL